MPGMEHMLGGPRGMLGPNPMSPPGYPPALPPIGGGMGMGMGMPGFGRGMGGPGRGFPSNALKEGLDTALAIVEAVKDLATHNAELHMRIAHDEYDLADPSAGRHRSIRNRAGYGGLA